MLSSLSFSILRQYVSKEAASFTLAGYPHGRLRVLDLSHYLLQTLQRLLIFHFSISAIFQIFQLSLQFNKNQIPCKSCSCITDSTIQRAVPSRSISSRRSPGVRSAADSTGRRSRRT